MPLQPNRRLRRPLRSFSYATTLAAASSLALAQSPSAPTTTPPAILTASQPLTLSLTPRQLQSIHVDLRPSQYNEIKITLPDSGATGSYLRALPPQPSGTTPEAIISDSGEPFLRIPIPAGTPSPYLLQLTALTNSRADTAPREAHLTLHTATPTSQNALFTQATQAFNHAERLRRAHIGTDEARAAYQQALTAARQLNDPVFQQRILLSEGRMLMLDGKHYTEAVDLERQAVAVPNTDAAPSVQALAWKMLGGALLDTGDYQQSLTASQHALPLYQRTAETFWQGIVLENIGNAQRNLGDLQSAIHTDQQALVISRQLHDDYGVIEMLAQLGAIQQDNGEFQSALESFSEAVEIALPNTYNPMQGQAWSALGKLHMALGENQTATADFNKAITIAQHTTSGLDELDALQNLARLELQANHPQTALDRLTHSLARARELNLLRPQSTLLIGLARAHIALHNPTQSTPLLVRAIELATSIHQTAEAAEAHATLAGLYADHHQFALATTHLNTALQLYTGIPDQAGLAQVNTSLARIEAAQAHPESALTHLETALNIIESSRASLAPGDLRTRYFALQRPTYDLAIVLLMDLDRRHPAHGFAARAWSIAERARARSLIDEAEASAPAPATPADQPLLARLAAADLQIRTLEDRLAHTGTSPADLEQATRITADLHQAILTADELQSRTRATQPATNIPTAPITPARFASSALAPHDALLEYWAGASATFVWLILPDGTCTGFQLPAQSVLTPQVRRYRQALLAREDSPGNETAPQRTLRLTTQDRTAHRLSLQLAATLLPAALQARLAPTQRLFLVADAPLTQLPFASLRLPSPGHATAPYLLQRFELIHEPAAAFLTLASQPRTSHPRSTEPAIAIFADPVYNRADSRLTPHPAPSLNGALTRSAITLNLDQLPRLPGSRQEALAIAAIFGPQHTALNLGFDATPSSVSTIDWPRFPIAHFATHAITRPAGRNLTGILLSMLDPQGNPHDGALWLRDIYTSRIPHLLVVLSGCGTAIGEDLPGEGMNSLTRAFLSSGSTQVAATLWSADDASASILMAQFYQGFVTRHLTTAAALRAAQLTTLAQPNHAPPYYWAGFILEGMPNNQQLETSN